MARWLAAILLLAAMGCRHDEEPVPYLDVTVPETTRTASGPNAFGAYANLAARAKERGKLTLDARDTPGTRRTALLEMGPLLPELSSATQLPCTYLFEPTGPFDARPYQTGWLHLSRALVYQVEEAVEKGEWEEAVDWTVVASCFGADLCGGGVSEATLGLGLMDDVRRALAAHVVNLPPAALAKLEHGLRRALGRMPEPEVTLENEAAQMVTAVAALQRAHKEGRMEEFAKRLYGDSREAALAFGGLEGRERNAFIQALADEARAVASQLVERARVPGAGRGPVTWSLSGNEGTLARQFFGAGEPWLAVRDRTLARTRLFFLTASLRREVVERGTVRGSLEGTDADLATDPYTGLPMGFLALERDFIVYSYGNDGKDDRGDTDSKRTSPDLLLESG